MVILYLSESILGEYTAIIYEGFAQVPWGGTHVKSTAEVGFVKLKREHPSKSIEPIEIRLLED